MSGFNSKFADKFQCFVLDPTSFKYGDDDITLDPINYGRLIKAYDKKEKRTVTIHQIDEDEGDNYTDNSKRFLRELELFVQVKSYIGIPSFYGYYFAPEKSMVIEYLPKGSLSRLYEKLETKKPKYVKMWNDTFKSKLAFGIACTMMHLHAFKAIHRRLRADIVYFDEDYNPKITEFALSKIQIDTEKISDAKLRTNNYYVSPEIQNDQPYSSKSDVYSFGVLLLSIVQGNEKFELDKINGLLKIPEGAPKLIASIIRNSMNAEPKQRPSFAQIVKALKTNPQPFPETDDNEYLNFVNKYMENVETAAQDQNLLFGAKNTGKPKKGHKKGKGKKQAAEGEDNKRDNDEDVKQEKPKEEEPPVEDDDHHSSDDERRKNLDDDTSEQMGKFSSDEGEENGRRDNDDDDDERTNAEETDSHDKEEVKIADDEDIDTFEKSHHYDFDENFSETLESAKAGNVASMIQAGAILRKGLKGVPVDEEGAFEMFKMAAEKGNATGLYNYATCLKKGVGTEVDLDEAYAAMEKAAAKEKNCPMAMDIYGRWLLEKDPERNQDKALSYFLSAMKLGNIDATFKAAEIYEKKNENARAMKLYLEAGELGVQTGYNNYALLLLKDPQTKEKGLLALKQNASRDCAESNLNLGLIELEGKFGVDPNPSEALKYFKCAAKKNAEAAFFCGFIYSQDYEEVGKDMKKAVNYYNMAANNGSARAMVNLANILQKDNIRGVDQDLKKAADLLKKAADLGNARAMTKYAECLEQGKGVDKDAKLAKQYRDRAAKKSKK